MGRWVGIWGWVGLRDRGWVSMGLNLVHVA